MAKFRIRRAVDAFVYYEAEIEATSALDAVARAQANEEKYDWESTGETEFDARSFVALDEDGLEIPDTATELG